LQVVGESIDVVCDANLSFEGSRGSRALRSLEANQLRDRLSRRAVFTVLTT
jgi:hypothetical protein